MKDKIAALTAEVAELKTVLNRLDSKNSASDAAWTEVVKHGRKHPTGDNGLD